MLHNPLQHARISQAGDDYEEYADRDNRCAAEAREGFLGIKHARNKKYTYGSEI